MAAVNCNLQRSTVSVRRPADGRLEEITRNGHNIFQFKQTVCHACNGFYGPSFGHPLCCTCHAFLYPDVLSDLDGDQGWKSDSEDSGNDEPEDFYDMVKHNVERPRLPAAGPKADRLAECISALSSPRPQESMPDGVLAQLPLEVLSLIFRRLDDVSLWHCSQVCRRWRHILECELSEDHWSLFIKHRWPLFKPPHKVTSWRTLYSRLVASAPCRRCLQELREGPRGRAYDWGPEGSWRTVRLQQELRLLQTEPPEGIGALPLDPLCAHWQAAIAGPPDSPYEGGQFLLFLQIPSAYPMKPPIVKFLTKIFHPNISRHGDIGIDSIHHNWSLALTISKVLISIQSLLTDPYCLVCMEPEVGRLYLEDRLGFERTARLWTLRYAMHGDPSDFHGHALESGWILLPKCSKALAHVSLSTCATVSAQSEPVNIRVRSGWLQFHKWHTFLPTGPGRGLASLVTASADTLRKSALSAHLPGTLLYFFFFLIVPCVNWLEKKKKKSLSEATSCDPWQAQGVCF